jgi:hypothetical protein
MDLAVFVACAALNGVGNAVLPGFPFLGWHQMPSTDQGRCRRDKTVHAIQVAARLSVQVLRPIVALVLRGPDPLRPQRAGSLAKQLGPARVTGMFVHHQRGQQRAGRTPHQFTCRVVPVAVDQVGQRVEVFGGSRRRGASHHGKGCVPHQVRGACLGNIWREPGAIVLLNGVQERKVVAPELYRAQVLQIVQGPNHPACTKVKRGEGLVRRVIRCQVPGVRRPIAIRRKAGLGIVHDLCNHLPGGLFIPGNGAKRFMAGRVVEHGEF